MDNKDCAQTRYDRTHRVQFSLKLNRNTDSDIIAHLETVDNFQGYIKALIRQDMNTK